MKLFKTLSVLFIISIVIISCGKKESGLYQSSDGTYLKIDGDQVSFFYNTTMGESRMYFKSTGTLKETETGKESDELKSVSSFQSHIDEKGKERGVETIQLNPIVEKTLCYSKLVVKQKEGEVKLTAIGAPGDIIDQEFIVVK